MSFYFVDKIVASSFASGTQPRLLSVCEAEGEPMRLPRVMHKHDDCLEIRLIREGDGQYIIDGRTYQTTKGDILVYNAGSIHDESASLNESVSIYYCSAANVLINDLQPNHLIPRDMPAVIHCGDGFSEVEALFAMMVRQVALQSPQSIEIGQHLLSALLLRVRSLSQQQTHPSFEVEPELGQRVKDYLDQNYQDDLTLTAVADVFHINQYYLAHVFKTVTGFSPLQYLIRRRIGEAQSLLLHSDLSIKDIATQVGFNHLNHFHSSFVKVVGMAPGRYRKYWLDRDADG